MPRAACCFSITEGAAGGPSTAVVLHCLNMWGEQQKRYETLMGQISGVNICGVTAQGILGC